MKYFLIILAIVLSLMPTFSFAGSCRYQSMCTPQFCGIVMVCCENGVCIVTPQ